MQSKNNDDLNFIIQFENEVNIGRVIRAYGQFHGLYFKLIEYDLISDHIHIFQ